MDSKAQGHKIESTETHQVRHGSSTLTFLRSATAVCSEITGVSSGFHTLGWKKIVKVKVMAIGTAQKSFTIYRKIDQLKSP